MNSAVNRHLIGHCMVHAVVFGIVGCGYLLMCSVVVAKLKNDTSKVPKEAKAKRDGVINPRNYNFYQFYTENFDALKTLQINRGRP